MPLSKLLPISTLILPAVAPTMHPMSPSNWKAITRYFRPKMSDSRPKIRKPTLE